MPSNSTILDSLINNHPSVSLPLPPLSESQPFSIWRWLTEQVEPWIRHLFHELFGMSVGTLDWMRLEIFIKLFVFALIACVLVFLLKYFFKFFQKSSPTKEHSKRSASKTGTSNLEQELEKALLKGEVSRALRLRWLLYLSTNKLPAGYTPQEKGVELEFLEVLYRAMFTATSVDPATFERLNLLLNNKEAEGVNS